MKKYLKLCDPDCPRVVDWINWAERLLREEHIGYDEMRQYEARHLKHCDRCHDYSIKENFDEAS